MSYKVIYGSPSDIEEKLDNLDKNHGCIEVRGMTQVSGSITVIIEIL